MKTNPNLNDKTSVNGFSWFICNRLCLIIEGANSERKKGLTVYSELGTGTSFVFYLKCDHDSEGLKDYNNFPSLSKGDEEKHLRKIT